jgi:hypothetical protein
MILNTYAESPPKSLHRHFRGHALSVEAPITHGGVLRQVSGRFQPAMIEPNAVGQTATSNAPATR